MTARCSCEVTVVDENDVVALVPFYQLSSSATKPDAPTTTSASAVPQGWSASEPSFNPLDGTRYLYTCLQLVWGDGTCDWGEVQRSSSYEQAKAAWNAADAASSLADGAAQREHVIYRRTVSASAPDKPSAWVSASTDTSGEWTTRSINVAPSEDPSESYMYVWSAIQSETVGGMVTCTDPVLHDSSTYTHGATLVAGTVTADKVAANAITVGALASDVADAIDGAVQAAEGAARAAADAAGLEYDNSFAYDTATGTYTFAARAWKGGVEITDSIPAAFFTWVLRDEYEAEVSLGTGVTMVVDADDAGWRAVVRGSLEESATFALVDGGGNYLADSDGNRLAALWKL